MAGANAPGVLVEGNFAAAIGEDVARWQDSNDRRKVMVEIRAEPHGLPHFLGCLAL